VESAADVLEQLVADLTAAGVRATVDQRTLNPPGALVALSAVAFTRLAGFEVEAVVYLVAPNTGTIDALRILDDLIGPAAAVTGAARLEAFPLPDLAGGDPLPALRATVTLPTC
jgi:hypothetical protein